MILTPLQKLPKNGGDCGKLIVAKGFKKLLKVQKSPNLVKLIPTPNLVAVMWSPKLPPVTGTVSFELQ